MSRPWLQQPAEQALVATARGRERPCGGLAGPVQLQSNSVQLQSGRVCRKNTTIVVSIILIVDLTVIFASLSVIIIIVAIITTFLVITIIITATWLWSRTARRLAAAS